MWKASAKPPGVVSVSEPGARGPDQVGWSIAQRLQELPQVATLMGDAPEEAIQRTAQSPNLQQVLDGLSSDLQQFQAWSRLQAEQILSKQDELNTQVDQTEALATTLLGKMHKSNLLLTAATKQLHDASQQMDLASLQKQVQASTEALQRLQGLAEATRDII